MPSSVSVPLACRRTTIAPRCSSNSQSLIGNGSIRLRRIEDHDPTCILGVRYWSPFQGTGYVSTTFIAIRDHNRGVTAKGKLDIAISCLGKSFAEQLGGQQRRSAVRAATNDCAIRKPYLPTRMVADRRP